MNIWRGKTECPDKIMKACYLFANIIVNMLTFSICFDFECLIHNIGELIGDNLFSQTEIESILVNLHIERRNQKSPVKSIGYIIGFRQFIQGEHHLGIICQCCNILKQFIKSIPLTS